MGPLGSLGGWPDDGRTRGSAFFPFSPEEGTPAANYPDQVSAKDKSRRLQKLVATQYKIVYARNLLYVGAQMRVVVDSLVGQDDNGTYVYLCRTREMAPQIDSAVFVYSKNSLQIGKKIFAKINSIQDYDLVGEVIDNESTK